MFFAIYSPSELWRQFCAAIPAEFAPMGFGAALRAVGRDGGGDRFAAFGAEFGVADVGPALAAQVFSGLSIAGGDGGLEDGARGHVDVAGVVGLAGLFDELSARGVGFGLGLAGRELLVKIGGAIVALIGLRVPADLSADPMAATGALAEISAGFFYRAGESGVMKFAADSAFDFPGGVAGGVAPVAEQTSGGPEYGFGHAERRGFVLRHEAIAAFVAMELELKAAVGR